MNPSPDLAKEWQSCFNLLPKVSRTFALSIVGLNEPLRGGVCVSYLLCRILDTIEDAPGISAAQRWSLMEPFLECLPSGTLPNDQWHGRMEELLAERSSSSDMELMRNSKDVVACYHSCDEPSRLAMSRWVTEMGKGMFTWSERMGEGRGVLKTLPSMTAMDRYCYYIAGTVGYLLTDLFFIHSPHVEPPLYFQLQSDAEAFGLGLQKVNIVKDLADDLRRGWCFIPIRYLESEGIGPEAFLDEKQAEAVYRAVRPVLVTAAEHLERGWRYLSRMPLEEREIRLFLAYSLFFAVRTLAIAAMDPAALVSEKKLKIGRAEVGMLVAACQLKINNPASLEKYYRECSAPLGRFAADKADQA